MSQGGADYVFESVGSESVLAQAYLATRRGGTTVTIGLPSADKIFAIPASASLQKRGLSRALTWVLRCRAGRPALYRDVSAGILPVDKLHTHTLRLEEINTGFDRLAQAKVVRQIISFA